MFANCLEKRLTQEAIPRIFGSTFSSVINPCSSVYHNDAIGATSICNITQTDSSIITPVSSNTPSISGTADSYSTMDIHTPTDKSSTPKSQIMPVTSTPKSTVNRKRTHTEPVQAECSTKVVRRSLDATVQVDTSLTSRTPRKLLLRRKLKSLRQAFLRQQRRESAVNTNKTRSQMRADCKKVSDISKKYLSPQLHSFFMSQIALSQVNKRGRRYNTENKMFALSIYYKSPAAYKLLSSTFQLPSVSMLTAWLRNKQNDTGFETSLITALQSKVQGMCTRDKTCVLLIDEMSIKSNLYFNSAADKIIGFEDLGDGDRTRTVACSVLVFMVSGLATRWKQPLGFFFVGTSCAASKVKQLLYKCLAKTEAIGLNVTAIISDQGSNFYQLCNLLAVTIERPFFEFNGKPYFYLFDSPHLLKSIRNNLRKHVIEFGNQQERACWEHIAKLYDLDSKQHYRLAPRLTKQHVDLPAFSSMRVKLASQVFSHSVSAALHTHATSDPPTLPSDATQTAKFCKTMNNLFDSVNSFHMKSALKYQCAISNTSCHMDHYREMIDWLSSLKVINEANKIVTSNIKCIRGWMLTLSAIIKLWDYLSSRCDFSFLITRRLNQDNLENFFGVIRQKGGKCDNPTAFMFTKQFSQVCTSNLISTTAGSNCQQDSDSFLVLLEDLSKKISSDNEMSVSESNTSSSCNKKLDKEVAATTKQMVANASCKNDNTHTVSINTKAEANALFYVVGVLLRKISRVHECKQCFAVLHSKSTLVSNDKQRYTAYRAYTHSDSNSFGTLHVASEMFYNYIVRCEDLFLEQFAVTAHHNHLSANIVHKLKSVVLPSVCSTFPKELILTYFCKLRINYVIKFSNRDFANCQKKQRKLFKIQSL